MTFVSTIDGTLCKNVSNSMYILISIFFIEKAFVNLGSVVTQKWFRIRETTLEENLTFGESNERTSNLATFEECCTSPATSVIQCSSCVASRYLQIAQVNNDLLWRT